ncbi:hypothetical protein SAMN04488136_109142 [Vibrio xiamenensis]|uniref:DUF554 domain-containing protein n=1 Tax=Vibrio xiamenensis TaxID=861298 RepID=A0A1G8A4M6_9VIBR|nr:DUF554 domain-containing protein [Vibrio xiamenensis]SDH15878.1 hypothetical protein SAMN04488136_109142 [Vibrio xiamenensis]
MLVGPIINSGAIIFGGIIGATFARYIPKRLVDGLPATFALASMSIGIGMIVKVSNVPVMVMALILGTALGELIFLEAGVKKGANFIQRKCQRFLPLPRGLSQQEFSLQFTSMIVLFGASGLGVIGSMTEGLNGNYQLLLVKSMMDFVTAIIFAISLGPSIVLIAVVQFTVQAILFTLAQTIMPYMDAETYANFTAIGGIIMVAVGLRISNIMHFAVVNFLPALFLVVPFTYLWRYFMG